MYLGSNPTSLSVVAVTPPLLNHQRSVHSDFKTSG
jgi:hypothetical protein